MKRVCPGLPGEPCGLLIEANRRRCERHAGAFDQARMARRGDIYTAHSHRRRARETIEESPTCVDCGTELDLTADHVDPNDPDSALVTRCRACNAARANRRRAALRRLRLSSL